MAAAPSVFPTPEQRPSLCTDNMRYALINIPQAPLDRDQAILKRRITYGEVYALIRQNAESEIKANNLYSLLYSKFRTTRFLVQETHRGDLELLHLEDDEDIKNRFKLLIKDVEKNALERKTFDERYIDIILSGRSDSAKKKFIYVTDLIDGQHEVDWSRHKELFFFGADQTTPYLADKLGEDLKRFRSEKERVLQFLNDYKFVNGWIMSIGITVFGTVWTVAGVAPRK
jgi:hypothetical protein